MSGTKTFVMTEKIYAILTGRNMDLRCKCTIYGRDGCDCLLIPHDTVISKPTKHGRKYYLLSHYEQMQIEVPDSVLDDENKEN